MNKLSAKQSGVRRWLHVAFASLLIAFVLGNLFVDESTSSVIWLIFFGSMVVSAIATLALGIMHLRIFKERALALIAVLFSAAFLLLLLLQMFGVV